MLANGEIKGAAFEQLAADPSTSVAGRFWHNTVEGRIKTDDGVLKRALLRNDQKLILGNHATPANNVRWNRSANGLLQLVLGDSVVAEGTLSTVLAQLSSRAENYTNAGKPAPGNAGRVIYVTDLGELQFDTGITWLSSAGVSGGWGANGVQAVSTNLVLTSGDSRKILALDSSAGSFNVQLPAPTANFLLSVKDQTGFLNTNPVTLTRSGGGVQIQGLASDYILRSDFGGWTLYSDGSHFYFE